MNRDAPGAEATGSESGVRADAEAQLRAILDSSLDALITSDENGRIVEFNRAAERIFGHRREDVLGREMAEIVVPPSLREAHRQGMARHRATGEARILGRRLEITAMRSDGSEFPVELTVTRVPTSGSLAGILFTATIRDITERKRAEDGDRFLVEAARLLASSLDEDATLKRVAELAIPRLGDWSAVELIGPYGRLDLLSAAHIDPGKTEVVRGIRERYPVHIDDPTGSAAVVRTGVPSLVPEITDEMLVASAKDEEHLAMIRALGLTSWICAPLAARGRVFGVLSFATSGSHRRLDRFDLLLAERVASLSAIAIDNARLYREAQKAVRLRDDFLAVAGHELRTPLSRLSLQVELLQRESEPREGRTDWAEKAQKSVIRLASLIDELLDVSRISEGRLTLQPERIDLAELAREVAARFAEEKRTAPPIVVRAEGPVVGLWDRRRLEQVVENLVSNAVKYGAGSPVEVEVALDGLARLSVADGGVGIASRDQARIFERFERAGPSRTVSGLGLGLWIVREVVTASGGTVSVESEPDRGSKFTVRLPLDHAPKALPSRKS